MHDADAILRAPGGSSTSACEEPMRAPSVGWTARDELDESDFPRSILAQGEHGISTWFDFDIDMPRARTAERLANLTGLRSTVQRFATELDLGAIRQDLARGWIVDARRRCRYAEGGICMCA